MYRVPVQRPASGGTAVSAGVLAVLGALVGVGGLISVLVRGGGSVLGIGLVPGWASAVSGLVLFIDAVASILLFVGAVLVFRRRGAGPMLVALGCAGVVGAYVVAAVSVAVQLSEIGISIGRHLEAVFGQTNVNAIVGEVVEVPWPVSVLLLVFPVLTFVLAVLPSTRRWCKGAWAGGRPAAGAWAPAGQGPHGMRPGQQMPVMQPGHGAPQGQWGRGPQPQGQPRGPHGPGAPAPQGQWGHSPQGAPRPIDQGRQAPPNQPPNGFRQ
ncbi:hypothetical protein ACFXK0_00595 [Nocardia sp. NPDC059177]|uniref:hypothetical protein n=1 Tax=Nocardia sp. NPDC059177 TaxID=3346759 RepID=UPI0036BFE917